MADHIYTTPRTAQRTIASFERYKDAQAFVDRLSDEEFPVEHVTIAGKDLRLVERVTGRLNVGRAALMGAGSGATIGAVFGLLFGLLFSPDVPSLFVIALYWAFIGALSGMAVGMFAYALTGGRRDFTSIAHMEAGRYDVMVDDNLAAEALRVAGSASPATATTAPQEAPSRT